MWTRYSRVIWLCLTKQHSQTQEFHLGSFPIIGGRQRGDRQRDRMKANEIRGDERGNISLAWSKIQLPERHASLTSTYFCGTRGKKQFMDGEKEAEISWSEKFRNVHCVKVSGLSGTRSTMTWLAVILKLRRLIGCGTFRSLIHSNLHSHWCRPIKLYMTARDSLNVQNLLQNHVLTLMK